MSEIAEWAAAAAAISCGRASGRRYALLTYCVRSCLRVNLLCSPPQFLALDVLAGMMMKGAAKCDKHAE